MSSEREEKEPQPRNTFQQIVRLTMKRLLDDGGDEKFKSSGQGLAFKDSGELVKMYKDQVSKSRHSPKKSRLEEEMFGVSYSRTYHDRYL